MKSGRRSDDLLRRDFTREDNLWVADIAGLTAATDVEHFSDLDVEVRDLIAGLTDTDPDDLAIRWRYEVNGRDVTDQFERFLAVEAELREQMQRAQQLQTARDVERLALLRDLAEAGLSQRAIGNAVALSHQRINQLINGGPPL
ncbi:MAG: MerR [Pseudonocardiales bacterium]